MHKEKKTNIKSEGNPRRGVTLRVRWPRPVPASEKDRDPLSCIESGLVTLKVTGTGVPGLVSSVHWSFQARLTYSPSGPENDVDDRNLRSP